MAELGQTTDPKALIPGDPETIHRTRAALRAYGDVLHLAGEGLKRIDTDAGWKGEAGDAFRGVFHGQPGKWLQAGDAFHEAATALDGYAATLAWAQGQATTAIQQWASGPANHEPAQETLNSARSQLDSAGHTAAVTVGRARDLAPPKPGIWSKVGSFFSGVGHDLEDAGATVVNDLASVGNAALHDPGSLAATAGGLLLTGVSTGGEGLGVVLDATGAGAIGGVPLNIASAAGIATGVSIAGAGAANILHDAAGPDRVHIMNSESASESGGGMSGRDIHGVGRVSERGVDVQHVWDNGDMYVQGDGQIVKVLDNGNGTHDVVVRDMANPSGQPTTVLKDATQKYVDGKISRGDWE